MKSELLAIFKAITPDNIKDLPLISDSMEIFIELLSENSYISSDVKRALSERTTDSISEELPKIYLSDYYSMIENLRTNKTVVNKFKKWNDTLKPNLYPIGMPVISDKLLINYFIIGEEGSPLIEEGAEGDTEWNVSPLSGKLDELSKNILKNTPENYYINRKFKESKGLKKSVQFIYDIINEYMVSPDERKPLEFNETGNPFELELISGSIDKDLYEESVAYLAHPLGFTYNYVFKSELNFVDDFSLRNFYNIKILEVRCLNGNIETYNKDVIFIQEKTNYLKIIFYDGTYLLQENDVVKYFNANDTIIKLYPPENHCSIYLDYEIVYETRVTDKLVFKELSESFIDNVQISDDEWFKYIFKIDQNNFIIGFSYIGSGDILSDDSDIYESVKIKDEFNTDLEHLFGDSYTLVDDLIYSTNMISTDNVEINESFKSLDEDYVQDNYNYSISDVFDGLSLNTITDNFNIDDTLNSNYASSYTDINSTIIDDILGAEIIEETSEDFNITPLDIFLEPETNNTFIEPNQSSPEESYNIQNSIEEFSIEIM